jgi:hypothetical protein
VVTTPSGSYKAVVSGLVCGEIVHGTPTDVFDEFITPEVVGETLREAGGESL